MKRHLITLVGIFFLSLPVTAAISANVNPVYRESNPGQSVQYVIRVDNIGPGDVTLDFKTTGLSDFFSVAIIYDAGILPEYNSTTARIVATANLGVTPALYIFNIDVTPSVGSTVTRQIMYNVTNPCLEELVDMDQDGSFETCGCNISNGALCDIDENGVADGVCIGSLCDIAAPASLNCLTNGCSPADMSNSGFTGCLSTSGWSCDGSFASFTGYFFTQDGLCTDNGCTTWGHVCYNGTNYLDSCTRCAPTDICDDNLTDGDFNPMKICTVAGECLITDCDILDGWYSPGTIQWVENATCVEKEQVLWEDRNYYLNVSAPSNCSYAVTTSLWNDTGVVTNVSNGTDPHDHCPTIACEADTCNGMGQCISLLGPEIGGACADGCDNDADGCLDGNDTDCGGTEVGLCNDSLDNNCDGEKDWDTLLTRGPEHGDINCQVGVTWISLSESIKCPGENINVTCTVSVADVNSVFAYIDENSDGAWDAGDTDCGWNMGSGWTGNQATFVDCPVGTLGDKQVGCSIYSPGSGQYDRSYQLGTDNLTALTVGGSGCCGSYGDLGTCEGDPDCDWCLECDAANKYSGGVDRCVNNGSCVYNCQAGQCGATCDGSTPCNSNCSGDTRYYNGWCELATTCTCNYLTEDCNIYDSWYNTSNIQWVATGICTEKEQIEEEERDYTCTNGLCNYTLTGAVQWVDTGTAGPVAAGNDTYDQCDSSECGTGDCNGTGGCGFYTTGEQNCPACQTCDGAVSQSCVLMAAGENDSEGINLCEGSCDECDGLGACMNMLSAPPEAVCDDGCDNDGDGCTDAPDYDCGGTEDCGTPADDNCNGLTNTGDPDCVQITGINAPATVTQSVPFLLECQTTAVSDCVGTAGDGTCVFFGWNGLTAEFDCTIDLLGTRTVACWLSNNQPGGDCTVAGYTGYPPISNQSMTVDVQPSVCTGLSQADCIAATVCDWCPNECVTDPGRWSGYTGTGTCVDLGTCRTQENYYCEANPQYCSATCDNQDMPCDDYCSITDETRHYNGWCDLTGTCTCTYNDNEDCDLLDNWYDNGTTQWVATGECTEEEEKWQEYKDYSCTLEGVCNYTITGTQWTDSGNAGPVAAGTDPYNQCDTTGCGTGDCDGMGACGFYTTGEQNCPACQTCNGATSPSCAFMAAAVKDNEGVNLCNGVCDECDGLGACTSLLSASPEVACADSCDNDVDGCTDAPDYDCGGTEDCATPADDNCNGLTNTGDPDCVIITDANAPGSIVQDTTFTLGCVSTAVSNCVGVSGAGSCTFTAWNGLTAEFDCTIPDIGNQVVVCYLSRRVDNSCIVSGYLGYPADSSQSTIIDVQSSDCSSLSQADCNTATNCDWCPNECVSGRWSGYTGSGACRNAGTCRAQANYYCEANPQYCSATCDNQDMPCNDYCVGDTRYHTGVCDLTGTCTCSFSSEDCHNYDGWYLTGATQWVVDGLCREREQEERENRTYTCSAGTCTYVVVTTQYFDTGLTRNVASGTDPYNQCGTAECGRGTCNGAGQCGWFTTGERNCPACQRCNGATSTACVNMGAGTKDNEGVNLCNGVCDECDGLGACTSLLSASPEVACADSCDNDVDGCTDAPDYDCGGTEDCATPADDNCNGLTNTGDPDCVIITDANAPGSIVQDTTFTLGCVSTAVSNCVGAYGAGSCTFTAWNGLTAEFDCTIPDIGNQVVVCYLSRRVDNSCTVSGYTGYPADSSQSTIIDVQASSCWGLSEADCNTASNCDWCPNECVTDPGRWSGYTGSGRCANAGACRAQANYYCEANPQYCSATCDNQDMPCNDYCSGDTRYYNGWCDLTGTCTCGYTTQNCNNLDGWYPRGVFQWVATGECTEKEQEQEENRDYTCTGAGVCTFSVVGTQWVDTGVTRNVASGTDPYNQCDVVECGRGTCNGAGACRWFTTGERQCPKCQTCNGATSTACVNIGVSLKDNEGSRLCNGNCDECNGFGSCVSMLTGSPEVDCGDGCDNDGDGCTDNIDYDCGGSENCGTGGDDNCNGLTNTGDPDCVIITDANAPGSVVQGASFTVGCVSTAVSNCVEAYGDGTCTFNQWNGLTAEFDCSIPDIGTKVIVCHLSKWGDDSCIVSGYLGYPADSSQSTIIDVQSSDCSSLSQADCNTATNCDWCPNECVSGRWSGYTGSGACRNAGTCRAQANYYCEANPQYCSATCDNQDMPCNSYCGSGNVRYYNGVCDLATTCTCSYSSVDCDNQDGWYDTGTTQWVVDGSVICQEKEQEIWRWRDYSCSGGSCSWSWTASYDYRDNGNTRGIGGGTDPYNQCDQVECGTGYCGGAGMCAYYAAGERGCSVCETCTGASDTSCVNIGNNQEDSEGSSTCGGCQKCDGNGNCVDQGVGQDLFGHCPVSWTSCSGDCIRVGQSGYCDGSGLCITTATNPCSSGELCSSGSCVTSGYCNTVTYCESGTPSCEYYYDYYRCDSSYNCNNLVSSSSDTCGDDEKCVDGSGCVSGCDPCDWDCCGYCTSTTSTSSTSSTSMTSTTYYTTTTTGSPPTTGGGPPTTGGGPPTTGGGPPTTGYVTSTTYYYTTTSTGSPPTTGGGPPTTAGYSTSTT